jgi:hypothetical protein
MLRKLVTLSVCTIFLALVSPSAAHAESRTLVDARGDVWAMDSPTVGENTLVPEREQGDILRTVFDHGNRRVVIRTKFAKLDREGQMSIMAIKLRTNTGMVRRVALLAGPDQFTNRWRGILMRGDGTPMPCASHSIDYDANFAEVRIPRSCLGDPRWIQGSLAAGTFTRNEKFFADNPLNEGPTVNLPGYTTRIFRG